MAIQGNNDSGDDSENNDGHNIIRMPSSRPSQKDKDNDNGFKITVIQGQPDNPAPFINLPPLTRILVSGILAIHLVMELVFDPVQQYWVISHFGFTPAYYTGALPFGWPGVAGPVSYAFLHGGWTHLFMNGAMLMAFGAGLERWMGGRKLGAFMLLCSLISAFLHLAFNIGSDHPVIGASGAISGMFAAALVMLKETRNYSTGSRYGFMPFIILWIGVSIVFGAIGGPNGESIAWAAHIGGFLAGFALIGLFRPR